MIIWEEEYQYRTVYKNEQNIYYILTYTYCKTPGMRILQVDYQKPSGKKCTYKKIVQGEEVNRNPAYDTQRYAEIDFVMGNEM